MIHSLTIHLSEEAFSTLQRQAVAARTSPAELAAASLVRLCEARRAVLSDAERDAARQRFERHFGEVDLGYPTGAENKGIDADLAAEYADTHEAGCEQKGKPLGCRRLTRVVPFTSRVPTSKTVKVFDITNGRRIANLSGHQDWVYSVAISSDET